MPASHDSLNIRDLVACHECDLLLVKSHVPVGFKSKCPRCGSSVYQRRPDTISKSLALALAGLFLFVPANYYPLFILDMLGQSNQTTMIDAVMGIYHSGMYWVAAMVAFSSIIMPFLKLFLIAVVLLHVRLQYNSPWLIPLFRFYRHTDSWAMLEVYIISLLVTVVKMADFGQIQVGFGMFCFVGLFLLTMAVTATVDPHAVWGKIEKMNRSPQG